MGKSSTEIQYDLERQRNAVEARVERLKRRLQDDVDAVKGEARADVDRVGRESNVAEHPKALLAGATVTGVVLGILTESVRVPRPHLGRDGEREEPVSKREKKGLAGAATAAAMGAVQGQLNELVREAWDSFRSGFRKSRVNDTSLLPPDVRSHPWPHTGTMAESSIPGGQPEAHGERYLSRQEISPDAVDADMAVAKGEKTPEQILHDARAAHYAPREDPPAYSGVHGEGLLLPRTPGVQAPYEEDQRAGERRTGQ